MIATPRNRFSLPAQQIGCVAIKVELQVGWSSLLTTSRCRTLKAGGTESAQPRWRRVWLWAHGSATPPGLGRVGLGPRAISPTAFVEKYHSAQLLSTTH